MSAKSFEDITYEVAGHKATITLNRPDALNALSPHMITELREAYDEAENDDNVWLLIVTGTGRAFCSGADAKQIPEDGKVINERPYLSTYDQWEAPQEGTPPFRRMAKPVLAAINGICCGAGLDWVTTGDIVIASDKATFFDPHVSIGLVAGREMVRLARVLPRNIALRMSMMGKHERMSAQRAYDLGMISEVVEHDRLLERAHEIADIVNSNAPLAVRGTRLAIHKTLDLPAARGRDPRGSFPRAQSAHRGLTRRAEGLRRETRTQLAMPMSDTFETILLDVDADDHVATITLNRPDALNTFNRTMCEEMARAWRIVKLDDSVNAVVLRAAGTRAFSAGLDVKTSYGQPDNVWNHEDPGEALSPKWQKMWKPVVCAVQGMCTAGAFYFVNESDVVICSDDATFFDSHVSAGLVCALEPIGLMRRIGLGESIADCVDGQRRTRQRRHRAADRARDGGRLHKTSSGRAPTRSRRPSPPSRRRRLRAP